MDAPPQRVDVHQPFHGLPRLTDGNVRAGHRLGAARAVRRPGDEGRRLASAHQRLVDQLGNRLRGALRSSARRWPARGCAGSRRPASCSTWRMQRAMSSMFSGSKYRTLSPSTSGIDAASRRDHRAATGLRLQRRYAEAFVERRKDECGGVPVFAHQLLVVEAAEHAYARLPSSR